ncbi:hypothetical protein GCM10018779_34690 [Streptomyces griseocarneus]|nr:hypothetical protein GCM10018779_34690 [Streptomyces griseocarneus]
MALRGSPALLRSYPRVEVRYGNPDEPRRARVVATATTLM